MCAMAQNTSEHQEGVELLRTPFSRTSENPIKAKFAEFHFHALGCIRTRQRPSSTQIAEGLISSPSARAVRHVALRGRVLIRKAEDAAVAEAYGALCIGCRRPAVLVGPRLCGLLALFGLVAYDRLGLPALSRLDEVLPILVYGLAVLPFAHVVPYGSPEVAGSHSVVVVAEELRAQPVGARSAGVSNRPAVNRAKGVNRTRCRVHLCVPHYPKHRTWVLRRLLPRREVGVVDQVGVGAVRGDGYRRLVGPVR